MSRLDGIDHSLVRRISGRLVGQKETIAITRVLDWRIDFGCAPFRLRRVGLFSRRWRDLHPQGDGRDARSDTRQIGRHTFRHRADGFPARGNSSGPTGADWASRRRARPARPATDMETLRAMPVSPSRASGSRAAHWKRGRATNRQHRHVHKRGARIAGGNTAPSGLTPPSVTKKETFQ